MLTIKDASDNSVIRTEFTTASTDGEQEITVSDRKNSSMLSKAFHNLTILPYTRSLLLSIVKLINLISLLKLS